MTVADAVEKQEGPTPESNHFVPLHIIAVPSFRNAKVNKEPEWSGCWVQYDFHLKRLRRAYEEAGLAQGATTTNQPVAPVTFFGAPVRVASPEQWAKLITLTALQLAEEVKSDVR